MPVIGRSSSAPVGVVEVLALEVARPASVAELIGELACGFGSSFDVLLEGEEVSVSGELQRAGLFGRGYQGALAVGGVEGGEKFSARVSCWGLKPIARRALA